MILDEIRLKDFRCFHGTSSIKFSTDPERNVTIVYAENGVGKTTILNALLWCFYGETTTRFEKRGEIVNYDARKAGRTKASVEVLFQHDDKNYIARRYSNVGDVNRREFAVARIDDGAQVIIDTPDTFINTVMPRDMASHFLFDGEHAEVFLGESNQKSVKSAIRDILGCSLIETAIQDLAAVSNDFRRQIPKTAATQKIEDLNARYEILENQITTAKDSIATQNSMVEETRQQIKDIEDKLRATEAAKTLQEQRDDLNNRLKRAEKAKKECADAVYEWLGKNGRFIVSRRIVDETLSFLDDKNRRGRIPSPYNEEFVNDILAAGECICGRPLEQGSPEIEKVANMLHKAADHILRDRIAKVRARLTNLKTERAKAPNRLNEAKNNLARANEEFGTIEAQLNEVSEKIKGINFDDIAEREKRREELVAELGKINQEIGSLNRGIADGEREQKEINAEINKLTQQDKKTAIYGQRRNLCERLKDQLASNLTEEENHARGVLRASIKKILESTTHKALNLRMTDDYGISLVNSDGTHLPKSGGENQLLGLAFTAALVEFAKIRQNAQSYQLLPGTIAPLVLDSPFGQLDESYRSTTAQFIPKMARQVVLLLSSSQASDDVLGALKGCLGAEYLLVRHNKEPRGDRVPESRHYKGQEFETAIFDADYDGTQIREIAVS